MSESPWRLTRRPSRSQERHSVQLRRHLAVSFRECKSGTGLRIVIEKDRMPFARPNLITKSEFAGLLLNENGNAAFFLTKIVLACRAKPATEYVKSG